MLAGVAGVGADRPTTQAGLGGLKVGQGQPYNRQVQDKTYWVGELRAKTTQLLAELQRLQGDMTAYERDNANFVSFEKKSDALRLQLGDLQGALGDYNMLADKLHTDADLNDVLAATQQLAASNQRTSTEVDDVFLGRQQKESQVKEIESQLDGIRAQAEAKMDSLGPAARSEYASLRAANQGYLSDIGSKQGALNQLQSKIAKLERDLPQDPIRQRAFTLQQRIADATKRKDELEQALKVVEEESSPAHKERLQQKAWSLPTNFWQGIKEDTQELGSMERRIAELEGQTGKLQDQVQQLDMELNTQQDEKVSKYEELLRRDKEMQDFLDTFPGVRNEAAQRLESAQAEVVALLNRIKTLSKTEQQLPSVERYQQLKGDLRFKETEMQNSSATVEAMLQERALRQADLDKVNQLESKLTFELKNFQDKIDHLQADIAQYSKKLAVEHRALVDHRTHLKASLKGLANRYEAKKAQLAENETHKQLAGLEQKLKALESTAFHLREFIRAKKAETEYDGVRNDVLALAAECNSHNIKMVALAPAR
ncbi:hypothetical protein RI367_006847 [Sorochytrium milnesiophthora]